MVNMVTKMENSTDKCEFPNCQKNVEYVYSNRKLMGRMFDTIMVCKEHYDLLLFIDHVRTASNK